MLKNNVICTFCLAKCISKGKQIVPFDYMTFKKNVICTFCLTKCIRKGQKNSSFWLHEEWLSSPKRAFFLFLSECHLSRKEGHLYFLPCEMHQKRTKKCSFCLHDVKKERHLYFFPYKMHQKRTKTNFLLTAWRMALSTKRTIFLFLA